MSAIKHSDLPQQNAQNYGQKVEVGISLEEQWLQTDFAEMNDQQQICVQMIVRDFDRIDLQSVLIFFGECIKYSKQQKQSIPKSRLIQIIRKDVENIKSIRHLFHLEQFQQSGKTEVLNNFYDRLSIYEKYKKIQPLSKVQNYDNQVLRFQSQLYQLLLQSPNSRQYPQKQKRLEFSAKFISQSTDLLKGYFYLIYSKPLVYLKPQCKAKMIGYLKNIQRELLKLEECNDLMKRYERKQMQVVGRADQLVRYVNDIIDSAYIQKQQTLILRSIGLRVNTYLKGLHIHLRDRITEVRQRNYNLLHLQPSILCDLLAQMLQYATMKQRDHFLVDQFEKWKENLVARIPECIQTIININNNIHVQFISRLCRFSQFRIKVMSIIEARSKNIVDRLQSLIKVSMSDFRIQTQLYEELMLKLNRLSSLQKGLISYTFSQQSANFKLDCQSSIVSEIQSALGGLQVIILDYIRRGLLLKAKLAINLLTFYQSSLQKISQKHPILQGRYEEIIISPASGELLNIFNDRISSITRYTKIHQFTIDQYLAQFFQLFDDKERLKAFIKVTMDQLFKKYQQQIQKCDPRIVQDMEQEISSKIGLLPTTLRYQFQLELFQRKKQAIVQVSCLNSHHFKQYLQGKLMQKKEHKGLILLICEHKLANAKSLDDLFNVMQQYLRRSYQYYTDIMISIHNCLARITEEVERELQQFKKCYDHYPISSMQIFEKIKKINDVLRQNKFQLIKEQFNKISERIGGFFVDIIRDHRNKYKEHLEWINIVLFSNQKTIHRKQAINKIKNESLKEDMITQIQNYFQITYISDGSSIFSQIVNPITYQLILRVHLIISNLQQMQFDTIKMRIRNQKELQEVLSQWNDSFNFIRRRQNWILLVQHIPSIGSIDTLSRVQLRANRKISAFLARCQEFSKNKGFQKDKDLGSFLSRLLKIMKNRKWFVDQRTLHSLLKLLQLDQQQDKKSRQIFQKESQQFNQSEINSSLKELLSKSYQSEDSSFSMTKIFTKTAKISQTKCGHMNYLAFCNHYQLIKSLSKHSKQHIAKYKEPIHSGLDKMIKQLPNNQFQLKEMEMQKDLSFEIEMEHGQDNQYSNLYKDVENYRVFIKQKGLVQRFIYNAANFMIDLEDLGIYHADIYLRNTIFSQGEHFRIIDFDYAFQFKANNTEQSQAGLNITKAMFLDIITQEQNRLQKIRDMFQSQSNKQQHPSIKQAIEIINSKSQTNKKIQELLAILQAHAIQRHFQQFRSLIKELIYGQGINVEVQGKQVEQLLETTRLRVLKRYNYKQFANKMRQVMEIRKRQ